jgi:hypothetical protein
MAKGYVSIQASTANTAGSTTPSTATPITVPSTTNATTVYVKMTNGSTAPTVACYAVIKGSVDAGTTYYVIATVYATTIASYVTDQAVSIPNDVGLVEVTFTGNTGQSVTVQSQLGYS